MRKFNEFYTRYKPLIVNISYNFSKGRKIPFEEFESQLSEELWICSNNYDEGKGAKLDTWVNLRLKRRALAIVRGKENNFYNRITYIEGKINEEKEPILTESDDTYNLEDSLFKKKEVDQRKLIDYLTDPDKVKDATTTAIVEAFPQYNSITALGKALGIHHETVKRKLRKLADNFDERQFGDYHDYLAI